MRGMRRARKPKRAKKVSYELIQPESHHGERMYPMLRQLVEAHHSELRDARIALAWCMSWKPDVDGRLTLGKLRKASDLDRDLAPFDFVILLNRVFWVATEVTFQQRQALLDHELCHAGVKLDQTGEPARDERDRIIYRTVRHDLEEFRCIVDRHGLWKDDVELMARAMLKHAPQYKPCDECQSSPGWVAAMREDGTPGVVRCECWTDWMERHRGASEAAAPAVH